MGTACSCRGHKIQQLYRFNHLYSLLLKIKSTLFVITCTLRQKELGVRICSLTYLTTRLNSKALNRITLLNYEVGRM